MVRGVREDAGDVRGDRGGITRATHRMNESEEHINRSDTMPSNWTDCLQEGDRRFTYLCDHFDQMITHDTIPHFDISYATMLMRGYYEEVAMIYLDAIRRAIIPWIHQERACGRLFDRQYWKPFRLPDLYTECYHGYRILFQYDRFYFQLTMIDDREWDDTGKRTEWTCFEAALYGRSDMEDTVRDVTGDQMMPEKQWGWDSTICISEIGAVGCKFIGGSKRIMFT